MLVVRGAIDKRQGSEEANLIVNELITLEQMVSQYTRGLTFLLDESRHTPKTIDTLFEILRGYPGNCEAHLHIRLNDGSRVRMQCDNVKLALEAEMRRRVDELLGPGQVKLMGAAPKSSPPPPQRQRREFAKNGRS